MHRRTDDFYINLTYNTKEYSEAFVVRFLENYAKDIHALAAGKKIAEILNNL